MMNELPPPLVGGTGVRKQPLGVRVISAILTVLIVMLMLLAIVAAGWAILYLFSTAP